MNGKGRGDRVERAVKPLIFHGWTVTIWAFESRLYQGFPGAFGRGVVCLYVLRPIRSTNANMGATFGTFCPKGRLDCCAGM